MVPARVDDIRRTHPQARIAARRKQFELIGDQAKPGDVSTQLDSINELLTGSLFVNRVVFHAIRIDTVDEIDVVRESAAKMMNPSASSAADSTAPSRRTSTAMFVSQFARRVTPAAAREG